MRIMLVLAYDGYGYHGWQLQNNVPTIQGTIEDALAKVCSMPVRIHGSGRTDAGVHAIGQTAHFDPPGKMVELPWQKILNSILSDSVRVVGAKTLGREFHARFTALSKTYSYTFWTQPDFVMPERRNYVWHTGPLDLNAMRLASDALLGEHDFIALMNTGTMVVNTRREIRSVSFSSGRYPHEMVFRVTANGFLKQMVRNIVGALVAIGRKKQPLDLLQRIISSGRRNLAPATAPARGLCLESVQYPEHLDLH